MEVQNEENQLNFDKLCRCCLEESDDLRSLFKEGVILGYTTTMKDVLEEFTPISINEGDELPQKMCFKCVIDASRSFIFNHTCMKSDSTLREYLISAGIKTKNELETEKLIGDGTLYFYDDFDEPDDDDDIGNEMTTVNDNTTTTTANENQDNITTEDQIEEYEKDIEKNDETIIQNADNENYNINNVKTENNNISAYSVINGEHEENDEEIVTEYHDNVDEFVEEEDDDGDVDDVIETINLELNSTTSINDDHTINSTERKINDSESETIEDTIQKNNNNNINNKKRKPRLRKIEGPPYKCEICDKLLSTHSSYNYHKQLHSDKTPFLCNKCGQGFKTRNAYYGHMTIHIGGHKCKICNNTYRQSGSLKTHMLMHTGEKPFLCGICGKGMTQKSGYKKHMLTHTGEKPFLCDICQKEFRYSSNLIAHKRSHAGYKSYICEICEKSFLTHEQLKRHSLIHTGERPFDCKQCGKFFNRKSSLAVHMNLHNGNRKHVCDICGKSYIQLQALQTHLKIHDDTNNKKSNIQHEQKNKGNCEEILIEEIQETTNIVLGV